MPNIVKMNFSKLENITYAVNKHGGGIVTSQHDFNNDFIKGTLGAVIIICYLLVILYLYLDRKHDYSHHKDNDKLIIYGLFPLLLILLNSLVAMLSVYILNSIIYIFGFFVMFTMLLIKFGFIIKNMQFKKLNVGL